LRILHLTLRYWPAYGGAEQYLRELSNRFAADGHHVTVAVTDALDFELLWDPSRRRVTLPATEDHGVRTLRFPLHHLPAPGLAYPAWRRMLWILSHLRPVPVAWLAYLARVTPWVPGLWRWLEQTREEFDIVGGMNICFEPLLEAGLRFARRRGIPFVIYPLTHLGAGPAPGRDALSRFYTMRHQIELVRAADAVVAQTPTEKSFYEGHGVPAERIHVVGPGVHPPDLEGGAGRRFRYHHNIEGPLVTSISSMTYDKGTIHLVEAVRRLWNAECPVNLVLAGSPMTAFRQYVAALPHSVRLRINVIERIKEEDKRDLLAATDIFALPSRTDSFGIAYLEAWLYGKPVIGARTWGVTDVIEDGRDGLLVPFGDIDALAQAISWLLDHPQERAEMGLRGQSKVYRYHTWERKYAMVKELYLDMTGAR